MSKLKWDITAVTSYDYLEYLLDFLLEPNRNRNSNELTRLPVLIKTSTAENIRLESFKAMLKSCNRKQCQKQITTTTIVHALDNVDNMNKVLNFRW